MFAIARFRLDSNLEAAQRQGFLTDLKAAHEALAACEGYISGRVGINTDEPQLIALITEWRNIGSYRRALSNHQVKMVSVPILALAIDEPGGYIGVEE